jgi:hypothetical protein
VSSRIGIALSFFTTETKGQSLPPQRADRRRRKLWRITSRGDSLVPQEQDKHVDAQPTGRHARKDDTGPDPLIDLNRDPTPGVADHARPDEED